MMKVLYRRIKRFVQRLFHLGPWRPVKRDSHVIVPSDDRKVVTERAPLEQRNAAHFEMLMQRYPNADRAKTLDYLSKLQTRNWKDRVIDTQDMTFGWERKERANAPQAEA